jgi:hypothetical protein
MGLIELIGGVFMLSVPTFLIAETLETGARRGDGEEPE